jgi:hypothetical protein
MDGGLGANIDSAEVLVAVLRGAIETSVADRAKRRLLLLLDAIDGELRPLTSWTKRRAKKSAQRATPRRRDGDRRRRGRAHRDAARSRLGDALDDRELRAPRH